MLSLNTQHPTYAFFFHPLDAKHTSGRRILAVITAIALTTLTCGLYLLFFGIVRLMETRKIEALNLTPPQKTIPNSKLQNLVTKQAQHLAKLKALADAGQWEPLQKHTSHPDSGFDWWMFPIKRPSNSYGDQYTVSSQDVTLLKQNAEFMTHYRQGVILVAKSWGWDLEKNQDITNATQHWTGYEVRLGKMLDSLKLFGENELHQRLVQFIDRKNLRSSLSPWVQELL